MQNFILNFIPDHMDRLGKYPVCNSKVLIIKIKFWMGESLGSPSFIKLYLRCGDRCRKISIFRSALNIGLYNGLYCHKSCYIIAMVNNPHNYVCE